MEGYIPKNASEMANFWKNDIGKGCKYGRWELTLFGRWRLVPRISPVPRPSVASPGHLPVPEDETAGQPAFPREAFLGRTARRRIACVKLVPGPDDFLFSDSQLEIKQNSHELMGK
jgi:hypothetical protein